MTGVKSRTYLAVQEDAQGGMGRGRRFCTRTKDRDSSRAGTGVLQNCNEYRLFVDVMAMTLDKAFFAEHCTLRASKNGLEIFEYRQGKNSVVWFVFYKDSLIFDGHAPDDNWYIQQFLKEAEDGRLAAPV